MKKYFGKNRKLVVSLFTRAFSLSHAPLYISLPAYLSVAVRCAPQSTYRDRGEIGWVYLPLSAYTTTLLVMVDRVKRVGRAPTNLSRLGWFYHHDGMYARKRPLPLCVYSVLGTIVVINVWVGGLWCQTSLGFPIYYLCSHLLIRILFISGMSARAFYKTFGASYSRV